MSKTQEPKYVIQIGSVVQLKSDAGTKHRKLTVVGADTTRGLITVIWSSDNGNIGKAEIPAAAINIIKA